MRQVGEKAGDVMMAATVAIVIRIKVVKKGGGVGSRPWCISGKLEDC